MTSACRSLSRQAGAGLAIGAFAAVAALQPRSRTEGAGGRSPIDLAHRGDRRLDHRDRLCARRGGPAGRPRFDQRLSGGGAQAARRRLYAGAVAGGRAVGQSDRDPRAAGQRPEGSRRRAEEGQRALSSTVPERFDHDGILEQDPRRRQGARRRRQGRRSWRPRSRPN